jgi:diguanylate cyclase (GGDEF)-like protein/PAS domain S-box-containing protein
MTARMVGIIGVSSDITDSKRAEARLRESERLLSTLLSNAPAYLYRCRNEPSWPNEFVSDYALELTGYTPEELTDGSVMFGDVIVEEDRDRVWEEVQGALQRRERFELRYALRHKNGEIRHVEERGQGVYREDGEVGAIEGVVYDVTERERAEARLREAENRYRTLVERMPAIVYIQEPGEPSRTTYVSPQNETILGYPPEECLADPDHWIKITHPEDRERVLAEDERTNRSGEPFVMEYRQIAKDGRIVWLRDEGAMVRDENGEPLYWLGVQTDITERKEAEQRLEASEAELRALFEAMDDLVFEIDTQGRYLKVAPTNPLLLYRPREELIGKTLHEVLPPRTAEELLDHIRRSAESRETVKAEYSLLVEDREAWFEGTVTPLSHESVVFVGRDITERKVLEERLAHQALHDPLTDLPNRTLFTDRLRQALARTRRREQYLAVMFMDLDNFKVINDSLGHKMGDRLLMAATKRIRTVLRPEDTVARLGGDEFVFLLEDTDLDGAILVAERILEKLRVPFSLGGRELFVTASIGITVGDGSEKRAPDLLRDADLAMYRAKHAGKSCHAVFEETMNAQALDRLELEHGLRRAVERDEFVVHYQPKVSLAAGKIFGFEALARWEHPEHGLLLPGQFVPVAEETGLIVPIGEAVLEEACRRAREWRERWPSDPLAMCVNLSARQFREPGLTESVARIIEETRLEPGGLFLEVTESTAMRDALTTAATLEELQDLGVRTILDDFGTGYSSLSYLERFPVDYIKIDRSFVGGLGQYSGAEMLVSAIINLAHTLGPKVIAEGVETEEQCERLRVMACDLAQGNLFSEPLTAKEVVDLLAASHHRNRLESGRCGGGSSP